MPWMTGRSTVGWNAAGSAITACYPVNSFTLDPERVEAIPGQQFVGTPWPSAERPGAHWTEFAMTCDLPAATSTSTHTLKPLLEACGFKYTGSGPVFTLGDPHLQSGDVYAGSAKAADIEVDVDGDGATASSSWQTIVKSWLGSLELTMEAGAMPQLSFSGTGLVDTSVVTTPYLQATQADIWAGASITSLGTTARFYSGGIAPTNSVFTAANLKSFRFATNARSSQRRALSATMGFLAPSLVGYNPEFELLVETPTVHATTNPKPAFLLGTTGTLAILHQFSTGNTVTIQCTNAVLAGLPPAEDVEGILCQRCLIKPTASSAITMRWAYA